MTDKQPEALRLAEQDEKLSRLLRAEPTYAPELRRLHEANAELIRALIDIEGNYPHLWAGERAREALAKAQGENNANG